MSRDPRLGLGQGKGRGLLRATGRSRSCCLFPDSTRPGWFDIGKQDGVITVNSPLDREQLLEEDEEVQVQVTVSECPLCTPTLCTPTLTFDLSSFGMLVL